MQEVHCLYAFYLTGANHQCRAWIQGFAETWPRIPSAHGVYLHSSVDLISGASVVTLVPRPCSPFCHFSEWKAGRGLGTRQQYSRVRLPQQLHEQHTLLCILSWACVLFVMLFRQHGTLCHVRSYVSLLLAGSFVGHFNNMTIPFWKPLQLCFETTMIPYQLPHKSSLSTECDNADK